MEIRLYHLYLRSTCKLVLILLENTVERALALQFASSWLFIIQSFNLLLSEMDRSQGMKRGSNKPANFAMGGHNDPEYNAVDEVAVPVGPACHHVDIQNGNKHLLMKVKAMLRTPRMQNKPAMPLTPWET